MAVTERQTVRWAEDGEDRSARWRSESGARPPKQVAPADDRTRADAAYRLACEGTALLWRGDYVGARQLLTALTRRVDRPSRGRAQGGEDPAAAFHRHRARQAQRARILGMLLVPVEAANGRWTVPLRRAPDVDGACRGAYGPPDAAETVLISLRELLGLIGAHEWHRKGVPVPALGGARVHPCYGVFSPVRGEYVDLVAEAPLPPRAEELAWDVGTGSGVLAAVLARRGVRHVVATDQDPRALACARENLDRLVPGGAARGVVEVVEADLFPAGSPRAAAAPSLVVCNPPWLPAKPTSAVERAVYDPGSGMLRAFLEGLPGRLGEDGGEGWLILSDLAELIGLRTRDDLLGWIGAAGLRVAGRLDTRPVHRRATAPDPDDPLHAARSAEVTTLWRLTHA
ncbi:class I SAM-dependent methyltransferase [Streptomyces sp. RKND-216]|uniref:methyltransferase n=1 Tax=Streptomyces sp. RKND-216 TaxID=2562581 RepID=UPI00109DD9A5|nr:class I SAM-dependent methyltransferase [Streptomyces sp. RKND-216]THA24574.1 class I SAM-dependent methyltransferase [Streptomyces sp. RKND-216]